MTYLYETSPLAAASKGEKTKNAFSNGTDRLVFSDTEGSKTKTGEKDGRRTYKLITSTAESTGQVDVMVAVALTPPPDLEDEFEDWYTHEHIDLLSKVPGWLRSRRFLLLSGKGPKYLAFHEYAPGSGMGKSPEFTTAVTTPACKKLITACKANGELGYERHEWRPLSNNGAVEVILTRIVSTADGGSTILEEPIEMVTSSWIGSKSAKYPASYMQFQLVRAEHAKALAQPHTAEQVHIEINVDQSTRVRTSDGKSQVLLPGDLVRYEDTTGKGHSIESISDAERRVIVLS